MEVANEGELNLKNIHNKPGFGYVFDKGKCPRDYRFCHRTCICWLNQNVIKGCRIALGEVVYK